MRDEYLSDNDVVNDGGRPINRVYLIVIVQLDMCHADWDHSTKQSSYWWDDLQTHAPEGRLDFRVHPVIKVILFVDGVTGCDWRVVADLF